jgi:hypothetical protein
MILGTQSYFVVFFTKERVKVDVDILIAMEQSEVDLGKTSIRMGGCWTYGFQRVSSPYI